MNITMEWSKRRLKVLLLGLLSFVMTYAILFNIGQEQNKKGPYHSECQCFRPFIHFEANQENIAETDLTCSKVRILKWLGLLFDILVLTFQRPPSSFWAVNYFFRAAQERVSQCELVFQEASLRGSHQKVITFTFYEATREEKSSFDAFQRDYFAGIEDNLLLLSQLYGHEWVMRLYYQFSSKQSPTWTRLCSLVCNHANIDICDAETNPKLGKYWPSKISELLSVVLILLSVDFSQQFLRSRMSQFLPNFTISLANLSFIARQHVQDFPAELAFFASCGSPSGRSSCQRPGQPNFTQRSGSSE